MLLLNPEWDHNLIEPTTFVETDTALLSLNGPALLVTVIANDGLTLRHRFDTGIAAVEAALLHTDT